MGPEACGAISKKNNTELRIQNWYESECLFRAPPTALEVARESEGPRSISFISFAVDLPLVHKHLE